MMAATPITKYFMGCKDDIPFFATRCSATVRCAGWGMVTLVPIFIYKYRSKF